MPPSTNGALAKWLSRSFFLGIYLSTLAAVLDYLKDLNTFVVVAPACVTGWFSGKLADAIIKKKNGGAP